MSSIHYIDRSTGNRCIEKVYGEAFLKLLYGECWWQKAMGFFLTPLVCNNALLSRVYGVLQKLPWSRKKIKPFIENYALDPTEFVSPVEEFRSFNDFFMRRLQPHARPLHSAQDSLICPADGRYFCFPRIPHEEGIYVKGQSFSLEALLNDAELARHYAEGSLLMARLCPTDYHRFHFPCDATPEAPRLINGSLKSVNPIALKKNIHIFSENKRFITRLHTKQFGQILYIQVGATNVGSVIHSYQEGHSYKKGEELGAFSFGGSSLLLLFEKHRVSFAEDLCQNTKNFLETKCLMGEFAASPYSK